MNEYIPKVDKVFLAHLGVGVRKVFRNETAMLREIEKRGGPKATSFAELGGHTDSYEQMFEWLRLGVRGVFRFSRI